MFAAIVNGFHRTSDHFCYGMYCHGRWAVASHNLAAAVMGWWRHTPVGTVDGFHGYRTVTSRDGEIAVRNHVSNENTPLAYRIAFDVTFVRNSTPS
jgi:hypothetical protein